MKKRILSIMLVFTILLTQYPFLQTSNGIFVESETRILKEDSPPQPKLVTNAPYGGVENIKVNRLADPGFEVADSFGGPSEFSPYGTAEITVDSDYTSEVYSGSYGSYMSVKGTPQFSAYAANEYYMLYQPERSYMNQQIDLEFWYNCKANPDMGSNSEINMYLQVMSDIGNIYLYYYLSSGNFPGANSTYYGYYDLRGSLNTWFQFDRNITQDFIDVFPTRDTSVSYIRRLYFTSYSPDNPTDAVEVLFDEVELTNSTAFNYMADNGDFEDGDSFRWTTSNSDPAMVFLSDSDYTEGSKSMNLTASSPTPSAHCQASADISVYNGWQSVPKGYFTQQTGDLVIEFDWKYSDTISGGQEFSYYYLSIRNETFSAFLVFVLGDGSDTLNNFGNSSGPTYVNNFVKADDFSVRDTWNHLTIDIYDLLQIYGLTNLAVDYMGFTNYASGPFAKVQLLVDDFHLVSSPANDPSFENNFKWYDYDPILAWMTPYDDDYVNITTDAYSGNYAANLSSHSGNTNVYCRRNMHFAVENDQYIDFMWRLDELTEYTSSWAYSLITLRLDGGSDSVNYIIGENSNVAFTNNSNTCYYYADGYNQIGVWNNLFRNLTEDIFSHFGVDNWNITQIDLRSYASGSEVATAIFDDLHFVRDIQGPTITNPAINPTVPEYDETVDVTVDVVDSTEIQLVQLHYQIDLGSWVAVPMTPNGDEYSATIPGVDFGIQVRYFFLAEDVYGHITQLGTEGAPYSSYWALDSIPPFLAVEALENGITVNGTILFNITEGYDLGSGVAAFEISINDTVVYNETTFPATFAWNTEEYENGNYGLIFRINDNAGNSHFIGHYYTVYNPPTGWETFKAFMIQWGPYIGGGAGALLIGILVIVIVVRRKRRV